MFSMPRITVLVGTCNRLDLLKRCLESVLVDGRDFVSVFVIDAGSTDGTRDYLTGLRDVETILETERHGQAWALNRAAEKSETKYLCWLSDDNVVRSGSLRHAVQILDEDPTIGLVSLKVRDATGPSAHLPFIGNVGSTGVLNCNQGVLRGSLFRELGGFDETLRDYFIDNDLTTRVLLAGQDVVFTKEVAIDHFRQHEVDSWIGAKERKARIALNKRLYEAKYEKLLLCSTWRAMQGSFFRRHFRTARHSLRSFHANFPTEVPAEEREWGCEVFSEFIDLSKREEDRKAGICLRQHISESVRKLAMPNANFASSKETDDKQMSFLNEVRQLRQTLQYRLEAFERICSAIGKDPGEESQTPQIAARLQELDRKTLLAARWTSRFFLGKILIERWVSSILKSDDPRISLSPKRLSKFAMYSANASRMNRRLEPKIKKRMGALKMDVTQVEAAS